MVFFKKLLTNVFNEVRRFLHLNGEFVKILYTNHYIGFHFYKISNCALSGQQNGKYRRYNSSFSKKLLTNVFIEGGHFLHLIGDFIEIPYTNQYIGFYFYTNIESLLAGQQNGLIETL